MPGSFGTNDSDNGCTAFTQSSVRTGVFGRNNATDAAPPGTVGGNGVFGLSTAPNASGVFGANNNGRLGVFGESPTGVGVIGAKVVRRGRSIVFQMAEVAVPRSLFAEVLRLIDGLRPRPAPSRRFSFLEDARREGTIAP